MIENPFPGPRPYRRLADCARFFGREDMSRSLESSILANRCVTVYGPSGAGKSSLMRASVIPTLIASYEIRVVRIDGWPEREEPTAWLASALHTDLRQGEPPEGVTPFEAVLDSAKRAVRGSSRLVLVHLDQVEQLLYPDRESKEIDDFFDCLQELVDLPLRTVRVVISLREDYLGRFRDRLRDRKQLINHGFRVRPMTVGELTEAVCRLAAVGTPSLTWSADEMHALMLQVRVPGQAATDAAEAQAAYAQIVCRSLFQRQAEGKAAPGGADDAEPILHGYLEESLSRLEPLREMAQRLLEDQLITSDGGRTLRTEKELRQAMPAGDLSVILVALEQAAILHAEEHHGSRYFEIGHDWLARRVFEQRRTREEQKERADREEQLLRELMRARERRANDMELKFIHKEWQRAIAKAERRRRIFLAFSVAALVSTVIVGALGAWVGVKARREGCAPGGIAAHTMRVIQKVVCSSRGGG
jgi:hypothetical protein